MRAQLFTFLIAMIPVVELRGAIPFGILHGLPPHEAIFWAALGNMVPNFFILKWLGPISNWLMKKSQYANKFFTKLFEVTHKKHSKKFEELGAIFLITFIAIPLPGTGAWTGSLIAWIYKVPYWKALLLIALGILGAGILITLGSTSVFKIFHISF